jgi:ubiquinone/menaquinone biosynthesis C-methylase UbiE
MMNREAPIGDRTRRVYDRLASVYPLSTALFHSRAHRCALEISGLRDGMLILEVATGSGEMFRRLVPANRSGFTLGVDFAAEDGGADPVGAHVVQVADV